MPGDSKLTYFKWFVEDAEIMRSQLTTEQTGELFLAVMAYLRDGTVSEVSPDIKWPYIDYQNRVNRSREVYGKKCATNAKNGARGGKAKAENARTGGRGASPTPLVKFTPPTKKQFIDAVNHMVEEDEMFEYPSEYDIDKLYDQLCENSWTIDGEPLQSRADWETFICANFVSTSMKESMPGSWRLYNPAFVYIFKTFHGLRDRDGKTMAETVAYEFCEEYSDNFCGWNIQEEKFGRAEWKTAIERFVAVHYPEADSLANSSESSEEKRI